MEIENIQSDDLFSIDVDISDKNITVSGPSAFASATTNLSAGDLVLEGGAAVTTGAGVGGDVVIKGGAKGSTGTEGKVSIKSQADAVLFEVNDTGYVNGSHINVDNYGVIMGVGTDWNNAGADTVIIGVV